MKKKAGKMAERTGLEPVLLCFDVYRSDANPLIQKESCHHANTAENQNAAKVRQTSSAFSEWMAPFLDEEPTPKQRVPAFRQLDAFDNPIDTVTIL